MYLDPTASNKRLERTAEKRGRSAAGRWADDLTRALRGYNRSSMKKSVETLLESFERLPEDEKREAAGEILKRSAKFELTPLDDDALLNAADNLFLELDKDESKHG